jgi:hypothetical protein
MEVEEVKGRRKRDKKDGMVAGLKAMRMTLLRRAMEIGMYIYLVLEGFRVAVGMESVQQEENGRENIYQTRKSNQRPNFDEDSISKLIELS